MQMGVPLLKKCFDLKVMVKSCAIEIIFKPWGQFPPLGVKLVWIGFAVDPKRSPGYIYFFLGSDHSF